MKRIKLIIASALIAGGLVSMPVLAEAVRVPDAVSTKSANQAAPQQQVAPVSSVVNINTADAATLADQLNGVGLKKAQAIVDYRQQNGPFKSVDDLLNVTGIGQATLEKNRNIVSVN